MASAVRRAAALTAVLWAAAALVPACGGGRVPPVAGATPLVIPGLPNLGRVSPTLLRGGQPTGEGIRRLAEMGVDIVVNLRRETFPDLAEEERVKSYGMRYVAIPMHGLWTPAHGEVAAFLALLREHADQRVFVHCRRGAERTGVAVAAFRIAFQGWEPREAVEEMHRFGFRGLLFPHYARYVRRLPAALATEPVFAAAALPAAATPRR